MKEKMLTLKKFDADRQLVWAEVYAPNFPDSDGDFASAEVIEQMAFDFLKKGRTAQVDVNHDNKLYNCYVVESFIVRHDSDLFIPESWVVGIHVDNDEIWQKVKDGDLNGFSMEVNAVSREVEVEINIPERIIGKTNEVAGHSHKFTVKFDEDGKFLGGETDVVDGHSHIIRGGTVTEVTGGHQHTFSFVEQVIHG